ARDIFRLADASKRDLLYRCLLELLAENISHSGFDEAGSDRVTSNVARRDLAGDSFGQADESGFGGGVVGLSGLAHLAEDAADVDDASPAQPKHVGDDLLDAEISGSQIRLQDGIPVRALHAHDELIARDAGIVDENVDFTELVGCSFDGVLDLFLVGDI